MINIAINGIPYQTFKSVSVEKSMDNLCGTFHFEFVNTQGQTLPFHCDDECEIKIDSKTIMKGRVERIPGRYTHKEHMISVEGRSILACIVDSTINGNIVFKAPVSLGNIAIQTLNKLGITGINVVSEVAGLTDFSQSDLISAKTGTTVFNFLESYARKKQVLISSDDIKNLTFIRSSDVVQNTPLNHTLNSTLNNILEADFSYDITQRFRDYIFRAQGNPTTDTSNVSYNIIAGSGLSAKSTDIEINNNRIYTQMSEQSSDQKTLQERANWESNIRKARSFTYTCKVQGFYNINKEVWDTNRLIHVRDTFAGIDTALLLNSVRFEQTLQGGSCTYLTFVRPDAYVIEPDNNKNKNKIVLQFDPTGRDTLND